jgi:SWI/SNF-related matrix-associated actin-dependent regulator of chromatin subfamily A3
VDDVFALIKFLRVKPFDDKATWTQLIGTPIKYNQPIGFTRLQTIMRLLALRRTKETKGPDGKPILSLPSRTDRMVLLKLQEEERTVYDSFFGESQAEFMNMAKADVMKNYVNILQKILRLRQICDDVQLIKASKDGARYDCAAQYEEALSAIEKDGINLERATAIFALLRETLTAQCAECGMELASLPTEGGPDVPVEGEDTPVNGKGRGRKMKSSAAVTRTSSPCPTLHPIITRCTHLFCLHCFRSKVSADWPRTSPEARAQCTVCQLEIAPAQDAVEVRSDGSDMKKKEAANTLNGKKIKRVRGEPIVNYKPSTKVMALLQELLPFSKKNPYSTNYDRMEADEVQELDGDGQRVDHVVKSVVL